MNAMNTSSRAFLPMLENVVARLPKLERIVAVLSEDWRSNGPAYPDSDTSEPGEGEIEDLGLILELDLLELVRHSIADIFSSPRVNLPCLTYLRLTLPCAYDFAIISTKISNALALQLRHLYLEYVDGTGPGGDLYYTSDWQGNSDSEGDEEHPFSNLQNRFANTAYMRDMCELINRCCNLESLGLHCTQSMSLDFLDWQPTSNGLKNIYIARAITSADKLLSLLSADTLMAFHIENISLESGTWESVFEHLLSCPSLIYFHVYNLIYAKYGESSARREYNDRPWENFDEMWSCVDEDWMKYRDVVRAVQNRNGTVSEHTAAGADEVG